MLIRHRGSVNVPENAPKEVIRFVCFIPQTNDNYFVVSSIEAAKKICPELFPVELELEETEMMAKLRKTSVAAQIIDRETNEKIRAKYSIEGELKAIRTNDQEYKTFVEQVVAEHNAAKDALFSL